MRLVILCEGNTEERVLKDFLQPYCMGFDTVEIISSQGSAKLKHEFKKITELILHEDEVTIVICLIDLYQAPFQFPKYVDANPDPTVAQYHYIKKYMEEQISEPLRERFYAFPVVMEIETWLLADANVLNAYYRTTSIPAYTTPETIEHPTQKLKELSLRFRDQEYSKVIHGQALFKLIDAQSVYEDNCPHFELIINQLLWLQGIETKLEPQYEIPNQEIFDKLQHLWERRIELYKNAERQGDFTDDHIAEIESIEQQMGHLQDLLKNNRK